MWPKSLRGRCWMHRMRNFTSKAPQSRWHEIKPYLSATPRIWGPDRTPCANFWRNSTKSSRACASASRRIWTRFWSPPASLATQEVRPHYQPDRTKFRRGTAQDQNTAPVLHREELSQSSSTPSSSAVAEHHRHRIPPAPDALRGPQTRSPTELGGGRITLRRPRSSRAFCRTLRLDPIENFLRYFGTPDDVILALPSGVT